MSGAPFLSGPDSPDYLSVRDGLPGKKGEEQKRPGGGRKKAGLYQRLAGLYRRMEEAYAGCAREAGLSCRACPSNCCTSFFRHHTYVEWSYLWRGLLELPDQRRRAILGRAEDYTREARLALAGGVLPAGMCPLNENGLCILYPYRLMICRLHGTRNVFIRPDGRRRIFPGCAPFVALFPSAGPVSSGQDSAAGGAENDGGEERPPDATIPTLDRTPFYAELAALELEFHKRAAVLLPRVDLTLAEMIILGPPRPR